MIRVRPAPSERIRSIIWGSTDHSPSTVVTTTGKKLTSATTSTLGISVNPNQTTRIGATATIGTICDATSHGYADRWTIRE